MNFKRMPDIGFALLAVMILLLAGCQSASTSDSSRLEQIKARGELVIGTALTAPFESRDPATGELYGLDVDLANVIARKLGVTITWEEMAFADLIPALQEGQMDMVIAGMYITDARRELVDMSDGYVDTGLSFVTRADDSLVTIRELGGKTVCVKTGSTGALYAKELVDEGMLMTVKEYADTPGSLADVSAGVCDAAFNDNINSLEYIKTHPDLKVASEILQPAQLGIAVQKGDTALLTLVNETIQEMKSNGILEEMYSVWVLGGQ